MRAHIAEMLALMALFERNGCSGLLGYRHNVAEVLYELKNAGLDLGSITFDRVSGALAYNGGGVAKRLVDTRLAILGPYVLNETGCETFRTFYVDFITRILAGLGSTDEERKEVRLAMNVLGITLDFTDEPADLPLACAV